MFDTTTHMPPIDHRGSFSKKRMNLQPTLPIPITYSTAAIPTFAPFGTEYTPDQKTKIVAGRYITISDPIIVVPKNSSTSMRKEIDPDLAPTKYIQHVHAVDSAQWPLNAKQRFDTTYRTEYTNRIRHPNELVRPVRQPKSSLNNFLVLPPIPSKTNEYTERSTQNNRLDGQQLQAPFKDQEVPSTSSNFYDSQRQQPNTMNNDDPYLPAEPVLLTDYEEQGLSEQIRNQLANPTIIDRLKLFYEELTKYDPNMTNYVHYSNIQLVASQLGLNLQEDTLRFAMCKFVSVDQGRGFVNYEDMVRYFGKCLSSIYPNQFGMQSEPNYHMNGYNNGNGFYNPPMNTQYPYQGGMNSYDEQANFDPDERQIRILLKQNMKNYEFSGAIDFDRLYNELRMADRNQTGVLNRQQIEEAVYKVRLPIQRSLIFQILEKHCRANPSYYRWDAFVQYLKQQTTDLKDVPDRTSPSSYSQNVPPRLQLLEQLRREYRDRERIQIIEDYNANNNVQRLDSNNPIAWFSRFLRLANAMYRHRTSTNREQDFVLPREEARRHFRAYNQVWNLNIEEDKLQRVLEACGRNANVGVDDALRLLAK
ncbi:unnamed protein product [Adineta ricciae]|uniref:DUF5580 domain-containing protein n=2 Tax=Adineta ricciae TaxID=249248 RepID=A0A813UH13_ADIRI|nr:unnamed protein product [Adineta ricciae]